MYKLRIKSPDYESVTTRYFNTLQEVAKNIYFSLNAKTIQEVLKKQKEYNLRFYITEIKENKKS